FDNPDFLPSGPRDVFVSQAHAKRARQVLADVMVDSEADEVAELAEERRLARGETGIVPPARLAFWIVVAVLAGCGIAWMLYQLG
ncbi:MAG TPA: hypothetical protein VN733_06900, partial [Solirubrobacterales bacterium]|nr:hypothetical protein [Solirubrobacterales bacterium]